MPEEPTAPETPDTPARRGITPIKAFAITTALLLLTGAILILTAEKPAPENPTFPAAASTPSPTSTHAPEEVFKQLNADLIEATQAGDFSAINDLTTPDGAARRRARAAVTTLKQDGVFDQSNFETLSIANVSVRQSVITLEEVRIVSPCFLSRAGEDVTKKSRQVEQTVSWTLRLVDSWRIDKGKLVRDRTLPGDGKPCG